MFISEKTKKIIKELHLEHNKWIKSLSKKDKKNHETEKESFLDWIIYIDEEYD